VPDVLSAAIAAIAVRIVGVIENTCARRSLEEVVGRMADAVRQGVVARGRNISTQALVDAEEHSMVVAGTTVVPGFCGSVLEPAKGSGGIQEIGNPPL